MFTCSANAPSPGRQDKVAVRRSERCTQRIYHQAQNKKSAAEDMLPKSLYTPLLRAYGAGGLRTGWEAVAEVPAASSESGVAEAAPAARAR